MPTSSTQTSALGITFATCLAFCLAFATGSMGLNAFLVHRAEGGSTGSTIVTFVSAALTWLLLVPLAFISCIRPRSKLLSPNWILTPLGLLFGLWLGTAIGWTVGPRSRHLFYCDGPNFFYLTTATDCSIYHAVLAMNWCAWAVLVPPYLGLLSLSIKESRRGNRHVYTTPIFEYPWTRSQRTDQTWKEMPDTRRSSNVSGGRPVATSSTNVV